MKRFLVLFFALHLLICSCVPACGEAPSDVVSYDFDFHVRLNADVFSPRLRNHMQGYADLLNMLELKGNIIWNNASGSLDLTGELIPTGNPSAAISFRFFGLPDYLCLSSPLLGDEIIWFQNYSLMEFALKAWNTLHVPLQYPALLHPYVTENAFSRLAEAWWNRIGAGEKTRTIAYSKIKALSADWESIIKDDSRLYYWYTAVAAEKDTHSVVSSEFAFLPAYLTDVVARKGNLTVRVSQDTTVWQNRSGQTLYSRTDTGDAFSEVWTLPTTISGFVPFLSFSKSVSDSGISCSLQGSYDLDEASSSESPYPKSLLQFSLEASGLPRTWPADASFSANAAVSGALLPNFVFSVESQCTANGSFSLGFSSPIRKENGPEEFLSCYGSVVPVAPVSVPDYHAEELIQYTNIFSVNDRTLAEFVNTVDRPLFMGLLDFLNELPASGCQSVMDDLEDYGILDMIAIQ